MECEHCGSEQTVKDGKNGSGSGSQRYKCKRCGRHFTPEPNQIGYSMDVRHQAVEMYVDGQNYRRTGRNLRVNHQSVVNWVKAAAQKALEAPLERPKVNEDTIVELDELFTFVGEKKEVYIVTQVDRETRCFMGWLVVTERTTETMQAIVEDSPIAFQYCTDGLTTYEALNYHGGLHLVAEGKSQTYSVEGGNSNSDLRHYLARLARKSRCFSRCIDALKRNLALFIQCWNRRQLFKHAHPLSNPPLRK